MHNSIIISDMYKPHKQQSPELLSKKSLWCQALRSLESITPTAKSLPQTVNIQITATNMPHNHALLPHCPMKAKIASAVCRTCSSPEIVGTPSPSCGP